MVDILKKKSQLIKKDKAILEQIQSTLGVGKIHKHGKDIYILKGTGLYSPKECLLHDLWRIQYNRIQPALSPNPNTER